MSTEFDIDLKTQDMYRFNMYHTYTGIHGVMSILLAILAFVVAGVTLGDVEGTYTILYILFGIVFLMYMPVTLYMRAKRQILSSDILRNTLHYRVDEQGITVSQNGESATLPWKQVYKMTATKHNLLIYSNRVNAYVIPLAQITSQYDQIRQLGQKNLEKYRYCIKER